MPVGRTRFGIEVSVLVVGWLLGGTVGVGTVLFTMGIGPVIAWWLPRLAVREPDDPPATRANLAT